MSFQRDWKEGWVDAMGLIVTLSAPERFQELTLFKRKMSTLLPHEQNELKECLRQRFTPSNGQDGCQSATQTLKDAIG